MNPANLLAKITNLIISIVIGFLLLRFILKLFGANAENDFVGWVYDSSSVLLDPFRGIFSSEVIERQYIIEFNTLFAILIYGLIGVLIIAVVDFFNTPKTSDTVVEKKRRK